MDRKDSETLTSPSVRAEKAASRERGGQDQKSIVRVSATADVDRRLIYGRSRLLKLRDEDYKLGPGDVLEISVVGWELSKDTTAMVYRVAESGVISLPVMGTIRAAGYSTEEIKKIVEDWLVRSGYIQQPRVAVSVSEYRSKKVAVLGSVVDPGVYALRHNVTTLVDVLSLSGGVNSTGGYIAYVLLKKPESYSSVSQSGMEEMVERKVLVIDLYDLFENGDQRLNIVLQDGDVVKVPEAQNYSVVGYVKRAGVFKLKAPTTVFEAIAQAGGLDFAQSASEQITIKRVVDGVETIIPVDLGRVSAGKDPNIFLEPNDIVNVPVSGLRYAMSGLFDAIGRIFTFSYSLNR
ncbi:MAG: polysaccharide export protein [Nitrospinota bacterium]|nr:polysaccharide export protein [Nitrospinota bacterium]